MRERLDTVSVPGTFHPADPERLRQVIEDCFLHDLGPGGPPGSPGSGARLAGLVVPHAGYRFSGPVAAHAYRALAEDRVPETVVVVGPDHRRAGPAVSTTRELSTPLGAVDVDEPLLDRLGDRVEEAPKIHEREHSILVQVPFLQAMLDGPRVAPLLLADQGQRTAVELGEAVADAVADLDRDAVVVASSDMSHVGPRYGQTAPEGMTSGAFAREQDERAIEAVLDGDVTGLYRRVHEEAISTCGHGAVAAMLAYAEAGPGFGGAERLAYATTQDVEDADIAVGYAAVRVDAG